jgi:2-dehydro-3-deoxyphosphogluconate aldolase/(4S)-4-hydroxy-2-oxoglutarate aldolase
MTTLASPGSDLGAHELEAELLDAGVFAILRRVSPESIEPIGQGLAEARWRFLEVSLSEPDGIAGVRRARESIGQRMWVGAGTVLTADQARAAIEAGAQFLVSPAMRPQVAEVAAAHGLFYLPGVMTPTDVADALDLGLPTMKLFPAGLLGRDFIRALHGPFPQARFLVVGNVDAANVTGLIASGAAGVGVGSGLIRRREDQSVDVAATARAASELRELVLRHRQQQLRLSTSGPRSDS